MLCQQLLDQVQSLVRCNCNYSNLERIRREPSGMRRATAGKFQSLSFKKPTCPQVRGQCPGERRVLWGQEGDAGRQFCHAWQVMLGLHALVTSSP